MVIDQPVIHIGDESDFEAQWEAWAINGTEMGDIYSLGMTRPVFKEGWWTLSWQPVVTRSLDVSRVAVARPYGSKMIYQVTHSRLTNGDTFNLTLQLEVRW